MSPTVRVRDGKIAAVREYLDTHHAWDVWMKPVNGYDRGGDPESTELGNMERYGEGGPSNPTAAGGDRLKFFTFEASRTFIRGSKKG